MNILRLLIVDDEPLVRSGIRSALAAIPYLDVVGEAASSVEAVDSIHALEPDLVLLDIHLRDATGFDVLSQLEPAQPPAIIFLTAYDEYAVQAFEHNAIDYVLKPFDPARLVQSIARARERIASADQSHLAEKLVSILNAPKPKWLERIIVKNSERYDIVPIDTIDWIESANSYVCLHCGAKEHLLSETLSSIESRLNPEKFARIHRRRIVNLAKVLTVHPMFGGVYEMELRNGIRIGSGRQYKTALESFLRNQKA
jgi:two-component system, LytTR family, response regulator